ncbi:HNH endonuclease [Gordonia bronchialis]|uniref:HNH endonuclease n=1 Tax=Gordonia bronchialis TaxID=2054 RepID=UPI00227082D3|nr:HNH endonuclease [Gordonia bronchialis]
MWTDIPPGVLGLPDLNGISPDIPEPAVVNDLVVSLGQAERGQCFLSWYTFQVAAELHTRLVAPVADTDLRGIDAYAQCAARIAISLAISHATAEKLLREALALRDRLPRVAECLRDGLLTPGKVSTIITGTDLCEGQPYAGAVDAAIADAVRCRDGVWSRAAIRDLTDRIVFRHDPDAVRERRRRATEDRAIWVDDDGDGMAVLSASMTAENTQIAFAAVHELAACACRHDPRSTRARGSDASFALLTGTRFECLCGRTDCDAVIPEAGMLPAAQARIVIHVVCDEKTLTDPEDTTPGYMNGYGVISADHTRELADRPDTVTRPINPPPTAPESTRPATTEPAPTEPATPVAAEHHPAPTDEIPATTAESEPTQDDPEPRGSRHGMPAPEAETEHEAEVADLAVEPTATTTGHGRGLAAHLPSNPYRPTTALTDYIHSRDGRCTVPGCTKPAWSCDLDHIREYNHDDPAAGGQTHPSEIADKCRFHHLLKTFTDFLDDMTLDRHGRPHTTFTTPEGLTLPGRADSVIDVIPALGRIRFRDPDTAHRPRIILGPDTPRRHTRTTAKHARRHQERMRNRRTRTEHDHQLRRLHDNGPAPPF